MNRLFLVSLILAACASPAPTPAPAAGSPQPAHFLFDDFNYNDAQALARNGWVVRTEPGWPGVPEAEWPQSAVTFHDDPRQAGNRVARLTASTNGDATRQAQFCHQRKYLDGTYAARVRFTNEPVAGPDGDQIVQTFYTISPLKAELDPDYSEMDFEYLPNGGWGAPDLTLFVTTWETFRPEPNWLADNASDSLNGSQAGWRTLVIQAVNGAVTYYLGDKFLAYHTERYFPETPMSINFNLWFIRDGQIPATEWRTYEEDIDWVYFEAGAALNANEIEAKVAALRGEAVHFTDTVPAWTPPLETPCDF